mmetsp:Transcript_1094/g.2381  ORF Transcript_1094/g.2381 Transcript_1094/m.2381 type:complete len:500 (+) Transcript_1094:3-1502(+)
MTVITVGSTVRAPYLPPLPSSRAPGISCRALVLTIDGNGLTETATVLYEDGDPAGATETTVPLDSLLELLPFEPGAGAGGERSDAPAPGTPWSETANRLKACGDALLSPLPGGSAQPDPFAALGFYASALPPPNLSVGSVVLLRARDGSGRVEAAEVDCVDDVDGSLDVTLPLPPEREEGAVSSERVIGVVGPGDDAGRVQERVFLNASRCLHYIAAWRPPSTVGPSPPRPILSVTAATNPKTAHTQARCHRAVILLCTAALELDRWHSSEGEGGDACRPPPKTATVGRYLRAISHLFLGNLAQASDDVGHVLAVHPSDRAVLALRRDVHCAVVAGRRREREMARDMCAWIDRSIGGTAGDDVEEEERAGGTHRATPEPLEISARSPRHVKQDPVAGEVHVDFTGTAALAEASDSGRGYHILRPSFLQQTRNDQDGQDFSWWWAESEAHENIRAWWCVKFCVCLCVVTFLAIYWRHLEEKKHSNGWAKQMEDGDDIIEL